MNEILCVLFVSLRALCPAIRRHARCDEPDVRLTAGDRVTVRGGRWVVEKAEAFADSTLLTLASAESSLVPQQCRLLLPFDRPALSHPASRIRAVTRQRWRRLFRARLSRQRVHGQLCAVPRAAISILPFQLEPALALIQGRASRFLLGDEVGLGKTIQAGLMLAELRQRSWCDRALIITPPGLRQQWADELRQRFDISSSVIDAASLSLLAGSLPYGVNPWTLESVVITSIDFIKQPEVFRSVAAELWDLVIVDEAHQANLASLRYEAVRSVAARARHLVLVTGTPHAGDEQAYRALCELGQLDGEESILLFRRTREQAGLPRQRRAHLLPVHQTPDAIEMHRQLDGYLARLWAISRTAGRQDAQLVALVLAKRAFSSAHSLLRSLERRVAGLDAQVDSPSQPTLPFDGDTEDSDQPLLPSLPAFDRADEERAVLEGLVQAARRAAMDERKFHALRRILRRVREPVIVFTEYRDTLQAIESAIGSLRRATLLHGGQTSQERRESIAAFTTGAADLLLATDAGSHGLNLQHHCRLVVNLELPWSPIRLEQRIGRVDRIGQTRTVHAINLFAAGTAEGEVLAGLLRRLDRIRMSEIELAACVIDRSEPAPRPNIEPANTTSADVRDAARDEAHRLVAARDVDTDRMIIPEGLVPVSVVAFRNSGLRKHLIAFMRLRIVSGAGRFVEDALIAIGVRFDVTQRRLVRRNVRATAEALVTSLRPALIQAAGQHLRAREETIARDSAQWAARALAREYHIASHGVRLEPLVQAGLFDSRALKQQSALRYQSDAVQRDSDAFRDRLAGDSRVLAPDDPEIVLLLFTC